MIILTYDQLDHMVFFKDWLWHSWPIMGPVDGEWLPIRSRIRFGDQVVKKAHAFRLLGVSVQYFQIEFPPEI